MSTFEVIALALIQGLTEFLPVSSSAHLILPSQLLGWEDQGLAFDVAVHIGTLLAVLIYFREEVGSMAIAWVRSLFKHQHTKDSQLAWCIVLATIPAALVGFFSKDLIELYLRSTTVIATTTIIFGLLLWWADANATQIKDEYKTGWKGALIIGFAQMLALVPGTSRSGVTIMAGLMLGLNRSAAARFSFLMSIPIIAMAGGYLTLKLVLHGDVIETLHAGEVLTTIRSVDWFAMGLGIVVSFLSAVACIHVFLKVLEKVGMLPFVIYRLLLGAGLFYLIYTQAL